MPRHFSHPCFSLSLVVTGKEGSFPHRPLRSAVGGGESYKSDPLFYPNNTHTRVVGSPPPCSKTFVTFNISIQRKDQGGAP